MRCFGWLAVAGLLGATTPALADCTTGTSDAEVRNCLAQDLRDSDTRINAVYKTIMDARDDAGKAALRGEQRAWLKSRDKTCCLDNKEADREKWLASILADQPKTACVVRFTYARVGQLNDLLDQAGAKQAGAKQADLPTAPQPPRSSPLAELIKRGLVKVNLGQAPFEYALPDGYRPFIEH